MPLVYIKCPATGYLVSTNHIVADEISMRETLNRNVAVQCPYCNSVHYWNDANGVFLSMADNQPSERIGQ